MEHREEVRTEAASQAGKKLAVLSGVLSASELLLDKRYLLAQFLCAGEAVQGEQVLTSGAGPRIPSILLCSVTLVVQSLLANAERVKL